LIINLNHYFCDNKNFMEKPNDKNQNTSANSTNELKVWETPQLFVENMETITEGGTFGVPAGDDGFYVS